MQLEVGMWENWKDLGMVTTWLSHAGPHKPHPCVNFCEYDGLAGKVPVALCPGT